MNRRMLLAFLHDITAACVAWAAAFWLRFNLDVPLDHYKDLLAGMALATSVQAAAFAYLGLYRGIWRFASLPDLKRIILAISTSTGAIAIIILLVRPAIIVPRSVLVLDPLLLLLIMSGSRVLYRGWKEKRLSSPAKLNAKPALLLGGGDAAVALIKDLARSHDWRVVGILDDAPSKRGRELHGIPVLGPLADLQQHATRLDVEHAIVAMPAASHKARKRAAEICNAAGVMPMTVPSFDDLMSGKVTVSQIRHVELDDLLGRDPIVLDLAGLSDWLSGRTVMITGAGGSIGSEICRQLVRFTPARLVFLEQSEFALYRLEQEFAERHPETPIVCLVGDIKNAARLDQVLAEHVPSVVFHAAAYKHVPLMENDNAWEAVRNNAYGTFRVASAAVRHGVDKFVLISTDKAVNPVNVMGASKRLAEMICQGLQAGSHTRFVIVRFGNVLGSAGSVIPKFREQIARGGPVTVTHPEIRRFFMSIPEAAQLVLQAGLMSAGGEIFVMDMGEAIKIVDLARTMIRLSGFSDGDIAVEFTGLRPGEKLYEEVLADDEHTSTTAHAKLRIARARAVAPEFVDDTVTWLHGEPAAADEVKAQLACRVTEYQSPPAAPTIGAPKACQREGATGGFTSLSLH